MGTAATLIVSVLLSPSLSSGVLQCWTTPLSSWWGLCCTGTWATSSPCRGKRGCLGMGSTGGSLWMQSSGSPGKSRDQWVQGDRFGPECFLTPVFRWGQVCALRAGGAGMFSAGIFSPGMFSTGMFSPSTCSTPGRRGASSMLLSHSSLPPSKSGTSPCPPGHILADEGCSAGPT